MSKKDQEVKDLYARMKQVEADRKNLENEAKQLKTLESSIAAQLHALIPKNKTVAGVYHKVWKKKSVSYAQAWEAVHEIIPKTKHAEAEAILQKYTKEPEQHSLKLMDTVE